MKSAMSMARGLFAPIWMPGAELMMPSIKHTVSRYDKPDHSKTKSRYMPHQGKREMARRARQLAKAAAHG